MNFGVVSFGSVENVLDILIGIALNMQMALGSMDILTINSSNPRTQVIFPFLYHFQISSSVFYSFRV